jgi:hypothetical protein
MAAYKTITALKKLLHNQRVKSTGRKNSKEVLTGKVSQKKFISLKIEK